MCPRPSRRRLLAAVGAALPAVGSATATRAISPGRWTQHGGDGQNTNQTDERGPQLSQATAWTRELPSADSAPLLADDTVFLLDLSDGGRIHGLYAATGTTRFTVDLDAAAVSGVLAVDGERVYTADVLSPDGTAPGTPGSTTPTTPAPGSA